MPDAKEIELIVFLGTLLMLFFVAIIIILFVLFNKRKQMHIQEKVNMQATFERNRLQTQIEVQEQTFNSISQEIHDSVGQMLSVAKMQLNFFDENNVLDKQVLKEAKENISTAMTDLRDIAKSMNSSRLQFIPLHELVDKEIAGLSKTNVLKGQLIVTGTAKEIDNSKKLILFRIVQECLQNIIKHAGASQVLTVFNYKTDKVEIIIQDNGKGFNTTMKQNTGLGLQNIINRAALIGGAALIESNTGEGTKITVISPYV